jgi:hypothetical protein
MNVSLFRTCLLALLLIPLTGWAQSVRPFVPVKVLQTDTFEYVYTTFNLTTIVKAPANAKYSAIIDLGGGQKKLRYSPENSFIGRDSILVEYTPKLNGSHEYIGFAFLVAPSIVTANTDYVVTDQDVSISIDALSNDNSTSGNLSLSALVVERFGSAQIVNGEIEFIPSPGFSGNAQIVYTCCNNDDICATGTINIFVKPSIDPLILDTIVIQLPKNSPKDIMLRLDGYDSLTETPTHGDLTDLVHDVVTYTPDFDFYGDDQFTVVKDVNGTTYTRVFVINVFNTLKDRRFAMNDSYYTHVNTPISFNVLDNDVGSYTVIYPNSIKVSSGTLVYQGNGQFNYTPNQNYRGIARFTYSLGSPAYGIIVEQGSVEINVDDFNPRFPTYSLQTLAGKPLVIHYSPPAQPWAFDMQVEPLYGTAEIFDDHQTINLESQNISGYNMIVYTPDNGFSDDYDEFEVKYCVNGVCKTVKFLIHVLPNPNPNDLQCLDACVWPGDANNDGVVNVRDLLAIGYGLGTYGPERDTPNTVWNPHFADEWQDPWTAASLDLKHLDTDGDGLITATDTTAISDSYLKTHRVTTTLDHQLTTDVDLRFLVRDPALYSSDTLIILDVLYGLSNKPAYDAYGFTFEIDFADIIEVEDKNVRVTYYDDSWFARQIPTLKMFKRLDNTIIHSGYTKTNGIGTVGHGPVGFVIVDDIEGAKPPVTRATIGRRFDITVKNITSMNSKGEYLFYPDQVIHVDLDANYSDQKIESEATLSIYPNPAEDLTSLYTSDGSNIDRLEVFTASGVNLFSSATINSPQFSLLTSNWASGLYFVKVLTQNGLITSKLQVIR